MIRLALDSTDREAAHYAAAFLQRKSGAFHNEVQRLESRLRTEQEQDNPKEKTILSLLDALLREMERICR